MKYDDGSWHFDSTPAGTDDTRWNVAVAHIAIFLRWCFVRGFAGELHTGDKDSALVVAAAVRGDTTATEFVIRFCDCKFTDDDLTDEGNAFASYYYPDDYPSDLESASGGRLLCCPEGEYDFAAIKEVIDERYTTWVAEGRPAKKPEKSWWKLW